MNLSKTLNRSRAKKTLPLLCEFDEGRGGLLPLGPCALAGGLAVSRPGIGGVPIAGLSATFRPILIFIVVPTNAIIGYFLLVGCLGLAAALAL
jgi:hypothetical protein